MGASIRSAAASAAVVLALSACTTGGSGEEDFSSDGPWTYVDLDRLTCIPGDQGLYDEVSMPIVISELPKGVSVTIDKIEPFQAENMVVHADDYRLFEGSSELLPGVEGYPPTKPFRALWDVADAPYGRSITAADLPMVVMAHITPTQGEDAYLEGFNISYTSDGKQYIVRTVSRLAVPYGPCDPADYPVE